MNDTLRSTAKATSIELVAETDVARSSKKVARPLKPGALPLHPVGPLGAWPDLPTDIQLTIAPKQVADAVRFFGNDLLDGKVDRVATEYGVDKSIVGAGLLAAAATALGLNVKISASGGWSERAIIWLTLLCPPAFKKSVMLRTTASHLLTIQKREHAAWQADFRNAVAEKKALEKAQAAYERRAARALVSGDGEPVAPDRHPDDVEVPLEPCLLSDNFSAASIIDCVFRSKRGILLKPDELASVLSAARIGSQMRSVLLTGFDGSEYAVTRGKPAKSVTIPRFGFCVMSAIQPDALRRLPLTMNDGIFTRFLWVSQKTRPPFVLPSAIGQDEALAQIFDRLRTMGEAEDGDVPLSPAAVSLFTVATPAWQTKEEILGGVAGSWHLRAPSHCLRIALTMACIEAAHRGQDTLPSSVSGAIMRRAILLVDKVFIPHMFVAVESLGETPVMSTAMRLVRHLHHHRCRSFNRRALHRAHKGLFGDLKTFNDAVEDLLRDGVIKPAEAVPGKGGRRSSDFVVNPKLLALEQRQLR
jgi:hypothetical protein